ncbi:hypothetical protein BgiBS90_009057 [Biomphalaria glabrata]|nr:hypothetical protein BgiBS90_009057 [Biomphalaria glabrata]
MWGFSNDQDEAGLRVESDWRAPCQSFSKRTRLSLTTPGTQHAHGHRHQRARFFPEGWVPLSCSIVGKGVAQAKAPEIPAVLKNARWGSQGAATMKEPSGWGSLTSRWSRACGIMTSPGSSRFVRDPRVTFHG